MPVDGAAAQAAMIEPVEADWSDEQDRFRRASERREPRGRIKPDAPANSAVALLAGPFEPAVTRIWRGARIGAYLGAPDARRHLWHCCLAAESGAFEVADPDGADAVFERFASDKAKRLLADAYGSAPPGLRGALGRLGATARPAEVYRALVGLMRNGGAGARLLRASETLADWRILAVAALPPPMRLKRVLDDLSGYCNPAGEAAQLAWSLRRIEALDGPNAVAAILAATRPTKALEAWEKRLPFPSPPWRGEERLKPLCSSEELKLVGEALKNCVPQRLDSLAREVRIGLSAYYEWRGDEPALLAFTAVPPFGWKLEEAKGRRNCPLSAGTRAAILAALAKCPDFAPIWPADDDDLLNGI